MANSNANVDVVTIGGTIATVGVGAQIPALGGICTSLISTLTTSSAVSGAAGVGASIAGATIGIVGAPALIVGGLAIVGYELFKD